MIAQKARQEKRGSLSIKQTFRISEALKPHEPKLDSVMIKEELVVEDMENVSQREWKVTLQICPTFSMLHGK